MEDTAAIDSTGGFERSDNEPIDAELSVAVAQPRSTAGAVAAHAELMYQSHPRPVVFPELSLTGHQLDTSPMDVASDVMEPLPSACAATGSAALVGASVEYNCRRYIATVLVDATGAAVVYRKTYLGAEGQSWFSSGSGPQAIHFAGWRIGLGTCRDTGIDEHISGTAQLVVDLYACGVVHHDCELAPNNSAAHASSLRRATRRWPWPASRARPGKAFAAPQATRQSGRQSRR